ncbi:MAG: type II secretion system protein [Rariglobus sp.]|nr:type II secretion system protein [Rariglobus sp.]
MPTPQLRNRTVAGFTLVEICVAVSIIGLLCAICMPAYRKIKERSLNTLTTNELRIASGALEHFVLEKGYWPPDGAGSLPTDLNGYLPPPDRWYKPTPIGGTWAWSLNADGVAAALRIDNFVVPANQISSLDKMMDDGNPNTGNVIITGQSLLYVLEK